MLEGTNPARVFTDDTLEHETVLMYCEHVDYIIMGNTIQGPVRQFIKDMPSEVEIFN